MIKHCDLSATIYYYYTLNWLSDVIGGYTNPAISLGLYKKKHFLCPSSIKMSKFTCIKKIFCINDPNLTDIEFCLLV